MFIKTKEYLEYKKLTAMKSINLMCAKIRMLEISNADQYVIDSHKGQLDLDRKYIASVEKEIAEFSK